MHIPRHETVYQYTFNVFHKRPKITPVSLADNYWLTEKTKLLWLNYIKDCTSTAMRPLTCCTSLTQQTNVCFETNNVWNYRQCIPSSHTILCECHVIHRTKKFLYSLFLRPAPTCLLFFPLSKFYLPLPPLQVLSSFYTVQLRVPPLESALVMLWNLRN